MNFAYNLVGSPLKSRLKLFIGDFYKFRFVTK